MGRAAADAEAAALAELGVELGVLVLRDGYGLIGANASTDAASAAVVLDDDRMVHLLLHVDAQVGPAHIRCGPGLSDAVRDVLGARARPCNEDSRGAGGYVGDLLVDLLHEAAVRELHVEQLR